eukprot:9625456-Ditylum_brightwellii.AAC.1
MKRAEACEDIARAQHKTVLRPHPTQRVPATNVFIDPVSKYDLVVHNIVSLALQRMGMPKTPICCTFAMLQDMVHSVQTAYGDSL